jgi:hypothetical protein
LASQFFDIFSDERLAASQADFFDAERDKNFGNIRNLLEREDSIFAGESGLAVRQAIEAAKVAAVCQRNAQVADYSVVSIKQGHSEMIPENG